jgi:GNAT superfamily N-acetyltransferase
MSSGGQTGPDVDIISGPIPGSIDRVTELHAVCYQREWGFGPYFQTKVATELAAFLERFDERTDGFWTAVVDGRIEGAIAIDGFRAATEGAHLRWFVMSDALRGQGVGSRLMETAMAFCQSRGFDRVYLWTFEGLDAARHLYEKHGFALTAQQPGSTWGREVLEQRMELCDNGGQSAGG